MSNNALVGVALLVLVALAIAYVVYRNVVQPKQEEASHKAHAFGETRYPNGNPPAEAVVTGPTLWDGDHSTNMPLHPTPHPSGVGWTIRFPKRGQGKVDYLGFPTGPVTGKTQIRIKGELTLVGDAKVEATPQPEMGDTGSDYRARLTPFFQEDGDDWSAAGIYEPMRQYYDTGADLHYLDAGEFEFVAPLAGPGWGGTQTSTFENDPTGFEAAKANAYAAGVVLGGNGIGIGHGADDVGTEPGSYAELWIKEIAIEE